MNRLDIIKQAAQKAKAKKLNTTVEELQFQESIVKLDARKVALKEEMRLHKKLTRSVQKAGHQTAGSLDCFKEENMYHSEKDTARFLENSSYMDAYNANRSADGDY
jgi:hypothetical protein|tara:strand:- start:914 stop:1231 length:318 start_codon:yes stop_codon:yes gene_type:complete